MAGFEVAAETKESPRPQKVPLILSDRSVSSMVWELAWPAVVVNLIQSVNMFVDSHFLGSLGTDALAGAALFSTIAWLMLALAIAVGSAATALVARFYGAMDIEQARKAMRECLSITILISVASALLILASMRPLLHALLGDSGEAARVAAERMLFAALAGIPAVFVMNVLVGALRAIGDTRSPIRVMVAMVMIHVGVSWVLIFGHLGFRPMGVAGSGVGLSVSAWCAVLLYLPIMARRDLGAVPFPRWPEWSWTVRVLRLAYPSALQAEARNLGMLAFSKILAMTSAPEAALATLRIGLVVESIAFMPGFGYAVAASALVGQSLGAALPKRGEHVAWIASLQASGAMTALALIFVLFARPFASFFSDDPAVLDMTVTYLYIAALSHPFLAVFMVMGMALQGAGDTLRSAVNSIVSMWVVRIPLAYLLALALPYGATGAWWAMTIATIFGGLQGAYIFWRGKWKAVQV